MKKNKLYEDIIYLGCLFFLLILISIICDLLRLNNIIPKQIFNFLNLILLVLIIVIVIVVIIKTSKNGLLSKPKKNVITSNNSIINQPKKIEKIEDYLSENDFITTAFNIFCRFRLSLVNDDMESLKSFTTDELYNMYMLQKKYDKSGRKYIFDDILFEDAKIVDIKIDNNIQNIIIDLTISGYDYFIGDETTTSYIDDNTRVRSNYKLSFINPIYQQKRIICSSCGAELEKSINNLCNYCGSKELEQVDNWILSECVKLSQYNV